MFPVFIQGGLHACVCVCRSLPVMRRKLKASTQRECVAGCFSFHCGPDRAAQVVVAHSNAKTKVPLCVCVCQIPAQMPVVRAHFFLLGGSLWFHAHALSFPLPFWFGSCCVGDHRRIICAVLLPAPAPLASGIIFVLHVSRHKRRCVSPNLPSRR